MERLTIDLPFDMGRTSGFLFPVCHSAAISVTNGGRGCQADKALKYLKQGITCGAKSSGTRPLKVSIKRVCVLYSAIVPVSLINSPTCLSVLEQYELIVLGLLVVWNWGAEAGHETRLFFVSIVVTLTGQEMGFLVVRDFFSYMLS